MAIRILIADDHGIVRDGLRALLAEQSDMEVIGEAADGREAVRLVRELTPDLVLMDVSMPELNGIEAVHQIVRNNTRAKVIALSVHSDRRFVSCMLGAGASGYLVKDCAFEELVRAIRVVTAGQTYLSPAVTGMVVEDYLRQGVGDSTSMYEDLTDREREVLQLLAEGYSSKEASARLGVSTRTIDTYRHNLMRKLGVRSVAELTKYAIREGLTSL